MTNRTEMKERIDAYFEAKREAFVESVQKLVRIKSVAGDPAPGMPFGSGVAAALEEALGQARSFGLLARSLEGYVGTVDLVDSETEKSWNEAASFQALEHYEPGLGILVHVDVVGEGENWTKQPYGGEVEDGLLYGRGSTDDKGPAIAALYAMRAVKDLGVRLASGVRLIIGTDEETAQCRDTEYYFAKEKQPNHLFSPDGTFPVINTEKGGLRTSFEGHFAESEALPRIRSASGGYKVNVVPPSAEAVVEGLPLAEVARLAEQATRKTGAAFACAEAEGGTVAIRVQGEGGHSSRPEQAVNAVTALLALLAVLPLADSPAHRALQGVAATFPHGDYYGEAAGIRMADEVSGPLTINFSVLEYTPERLYGFFDSRIPLCATVSNTLDVLAQKLASCGVVLKRGGFSKPHHTPADTPFVQTLLRCYEQYTGLKGSCEYSGGGTYVHGIEGGVAFGCTMPGTEPRAHGADEFVVVEDLLTSAKLFTQVIIDLCGGFQS